MHPVLIFLILLLVGYVIRFVGLYIAKNIHVDPALKAHRERMRSHLPKILIKENPYISKENMKNMYFLESEIEMYVDSICQYQSKYSYDVLCDNIVPDEKILKDILMNTTVIISENGIDSFPFSKAERLSVHQAYDSEGYSEEGKIVFLWYRMYQWDSRIYINLKNTEKAYDAIYRYIQNDLEKYYMHRNKKSLSIPLYKIMYVRDPKQN